MHFKRWERSLVVKAIMIIIIVIAALVAGASELDCIKKLTANIDLLTTALMSCNIKILEGDKYLFEWDKNTWGRLYPGSSQTQTDQANRIMILSSCQELTSNYTKFINDCEKK